MQQRKTPFLAPFMLVLLMFAASAVFTAAAAAQPATARYQSVSENSVVFVVEVGRNAPSSLIIQHIHPASRKVVSSSPQADKIFADRGVCKWLIKDSKTGVYPFSLTFNGPVSPANIKLLLRYRHPGTKSFEEVTIIP